MYAQAKKKNAEFINLVEQNKTEAHIKERMSKKRSYIDVEGPEGAATEADSARKEKKKRSFRQSQSLGSHHGENFVEASSQLLKNVFPSTKKE